MPNGMRGSRRGRRTRNLPRNMQANNKRQHRLDFRGIVAHGRADPPRVLLNPWNTITLSTLIVGTETPLNKCVTFTDVESYFMAQTALPTSTRVYRVVACQLWHIIPNGELNNRVRARFYSLINETVLCDIVKVLAQVDDFGTPARNATAKFIWPRTHSSNVFSSTSVEVILRIALEQSQQVLMHLTVLWKPVGGTSTVTSFIPTDSWPEDGKLKGHWKTVPDTMSSLHNAPLYRSIQQDEDELDSNISESFKEIDIS